jgi:lactose/L-arabinose transport system permease protein
MITAATNASIEVARGKIVFGTYAATNFKNLLAAEPLFKSLANSFKYSIVQTVLCLFICSLAGYGFELYHDKAKDKLFGILLLAMMVPQVATMIPLFRMYLMLTSLTQYGLSYFLLSQHRL